MILRLSIFISMIAFFSCTNHKTQDKKKDQLYIIGSFNHDTIFLNRPQFAPANYRKVMVKEFCDDKKHRFCEVVTKFYNSTGAADADVIYYQTKDLGIIYSLNTTWKSYDRLHSTNDSIEKRINEYIDHILSSSDLVIESDIPFKYYDKIGPVVKFK